MTGITTGDYRIQLAAAPSHLIGVLPPDGDGASLGTGSLHNHFYVQEVDGGFRLSLGWLNVRAEGSRVVVRLPGPPTTWTIDGPDGGPNTIHLRQGGLDLAWTVEHKGPDVADGSPVVLRPFVPAPNTPENQKWYFHRQ